MRSLHLIIIPCIFAALGCSPGIRANSYDIHPQDLNVDELLSAKSLKTGSIEIEINAIRSGDVLTHHYSYNNKITGKVIKITGERQSGFSKVEYSKNNEVGTLTSFFPDGKTKSFTYVYLGLPFPDARTDSRRVEFPLGILYEYDRNGRVDREINQDKAFKFSLADLKRYLTNSRGVNFTEASKFAFITRYFESKKGVWQVTLVGRGNPRYRLRIDGKNGSILSEQKISASLDPPQAYLDELFK